MCLDLEAAVIRRSRFTGWTVTVLERSLWSVARVRVRVRLSAVDDGEYEGRVTLPFGNFLFSLVGEMEIDWCGNELNCHRDGGGEEEEEEGE